MKKLWLIMLAVVLAFGLVFGITGCRDLPETGGDAEELVIDDAAKIGAMLTAEGYYGAASGVEAEGNKASFDLSEGHDNYGFKLDFAEYVESGHTSLEITFKLAKVDTLVGGHAKIGFKAAVGADVTPYATHEIIFGGASDEGVEKEQKFSLQSPNKLPNKYVLFNHNKYGDDASNQGATGAVKYTLEITKLKFLATEPVPCCEDDCCDKTKCKDCLADKCEGDCGKGCCVAFASADEKIELVKGATAAADKVVHTNPSLDFSPNVAVTAAGVVTMNSYSMIYYKFPADGTGYKIADYDYIDISYTLSNVKNTGTNDGTNLKVEMRDYGGAKQYSLISGGAYDDFGPVVAAGSTYSKLQTWGDNGTGGFVIRINSYDVGAGKSCAEFIDIKITKIEFSKGTRATVEFLAPQTPSMNNVAPLTVLVGNPIGDRIPKLSNPGWTFVGWNTGWSTSLGAPDGTTVIAGTAIDASWVKDGKVKLYAQWLQGVVDPITINNPAFVVKEGNSTKFTYKGTNDWILMHSGGYNLSSDNDIDGLDFSSVVTTGTSRISYQLPADAKFLGDVIITFDIMLVNDGDAANNGRGAIIRNNETVAGGANAEVPVGNAYPWLVPGGKNVGEVAVGETMTYPASAFFGGGYIGIAKGDTGAFLIRISKIEVKEAE